MSTQLDLPVFVLEPVTVREVEFIVSSLPPDPVRGLLWQVRRISCTPERKSSERGEVHECSLWSLGLFSCDCKSFKYRATCRHLSAVKKLLGLEVEE